MRNPKFLFWLGRSDVSQYYDKGLCLRITPPYTQHNIELNKKQVQQLVKELQNWLGETELPLYTKTRPSEQINPEGSLTEVFSNEY